MGKAKIEFINQGFIDILSSDGSRELVEANAKDISAKAGKGFSYDILKGYNNTRWIAFVHSDDDKAAKEEAENKILTRAVVK